MAKPWLNDIVLAFRALDEDSGAAWLQDVYGWILSNREGLPADAANSGRKSFEGTIRATIESHSSDSEKYLSGYPNVFRHLARGRWALRSPGAHVPQKSEDLRVFVLVRMTKEELEATGARGGAALADEIDRRTLEIATRFGMAAPPKMPRPT